MDLQIKAQIKKAAIAEKKLVKKAKRHAKSLGLKIQSLDMKKLATKSSNVKEISNVKDVLSNFPIGTPNNQVFDQPASQKSTLPSTIRKLNIIWKKKAKNQKLIIKHFSGENNLATQIPRTSISCKALTPPSIAMKLIKPGKCKVKILANAVESTSSKQMWQVFNSLFN